MEKRNERKPAIRNKTWAELKVGDTRQPRAELLGAGSLPVRPCLGQHQSADAALGRGRAQKTEPVAPSMWVGSLVSAVLGNCFRAPARSIASQDLQFLRRVHVGDKVKVTVTCREKREEPVAVFDTKIEDALRPRGVQGNGRDRGADRHPDHRSARTAGADRRHSRSFRQTRRARREIAAAEDRGRLPRGPQFAGRRAAFGEEPPDRADPDRRPRPHPGGGERARGRHFGLHARRGLRSARRRRARGRDGARGQGRTR